MGPGSWGYSLGPLASMPPEPVPAATDHPHVPCAPHRPASLGRPMHAEKLNLATGKARVAEARPDGRRSARGHPRLRLRAVAPVTRSRGRGFLLGAEARACHPGLRDKQPWGATQGQATPGACERTLRVSEAQPSVPSGLQLFIRPMLCPGNTSSLCSSGQHRLPAVSEPGDSQPCGSETGNVCPLVTRRHAFSGSAGTLAGFGCGDSLCGPDPGPRQDPGFTS
ncbi:uncharacterized protein LOC144283431 isoform X1 [Canis aureus]